MSLRKLLAAVMVVSMVFGLVGTTVFAQAEAAAVEAATGRLQGFGIVTGDPDGGLRLADSITRAELMAVLVRANGLEDISQLLQGTSAFSDVAPDAWYAGYVAIAKSKGWTTGYPDGTFKPGNPVTNAEVLAFLARVAGLAPAAAAWPENYIKAAIDAGLVPADLDLAALASQPAVRGVVFTLADAFFMKVRDANGKNLYQRYHDTTAPVVSLDALTPQTTSASVKASGKVDGAEAAFVNGNPLVLAADGSFAADIELAIGANDIVITAVDLVGNEGSAKATVERINTAAALIEAPASLSVAAGAGSALATVVKDTNGAEIAGAVVTSAVEPAELGTYDAATGTFTAGTKAGTGTLTLTSGEATATVAVTVTPADLAKIEVTPGNVAIAKGDILTFGVVGLDAFGNAITGLTPTWVVTNADGSPTSKAFISSTGAFIGSDFGSYSVTATVDAFTASATAGIYGAATTIKIASSPATLVANNKSVAEIKVEVVDANGNLAGGFSKDLTLALSGELVRFDKTGTAVSIENGVGSFKVTAAPENSGVVATITLTGPDLGPADPDGLDPATDLDQAEAEVELIEQVATGIVVFTAGTSKYLTANASDMAATAAFRVVDQDGQPMLDGLNYTLDLKVSGPASFDGLGEDQSTATYNASGSNSTSTTVYSEKAQTGTVTVTATGEGLGSASAEIMAAIAGAPKLVKVSSDVESIIADDDITTNSADDYLTATLTVEVTDRNGVPTPVTGDLKVTIAAPGDTINDDAIDDVTTDNSYQVSGLTPIDGADLDEDDYQLNFNDQSSVTFQVNNRYVGDLKVTAAQSASLAIQEGDGLDNIDVSLTSSSGSVAVVAADPELAGFLVDDIASSAVYVNPAVPTIVVPSAAPKAAVNVHVMDRFGNTAPVSGVRFEIGVARGLGGLNWENDTKEVTINGKNSPAAVKTGADGMATLDVVGREYAGTTYLLTVDDVTYDLNGDGDVLDLGETLTLADPAIAFRINATVAASMSVQVLYGTAAANSVLAGNEVDLVITVKDTFGRALAGQLDFLELSGVDNLFFVDAAGGAGPADGNDVSKASDIKAALIDNGDGTYSIDTATYSLWTVKSGRHTFTVKDIAASSPVTGSRSVTVKADATGALTATIAEAKWSDTAGDYVTEVVQGKAAALTLQLSDRFGNPVVLTSDATVTWTGDDGDISIRTATDSADIDGTVGVKLRASKRLYVIARTAPDSWSLAFSVDTVPGGTVQIDSKAE